ncbi:MAG: phosphodiester glycosidase family protein [Actinomycetota bacterium]
MSLSYRRSVVVSLIALLIVGLMPQAHARRTRVKRLSKGVVYRVYEEHNPRLKIRTVTIQPYRVDEIRAVLGSGQLPGWERTSSIARRTRAVAAINGDYGRPSGRPVMAFAHSARLIQTPLTAGKNFGVSYGRDAMIGFPRPHIWLNAAGLNLPIARVNNGGPYGNSLAMFDRSGGSIERPPRLGCSIRVVSAGFPHPDSDRSGVVARYRVDRVKCTRGRLFPLGGRVISARWRTRKARLIAALPKGTVVSLGWSLGWGALRESVGGNPTLVENGRVVVPKSTAPFFARHPRTGVGVTPRGKVIFATVDGRQRRSVGMTLRGFARFFRGLGAETALNLDGGGSTTMVVRGRVMNRPSDGAERPVSSALVVLPRDGVRRSFRAIGTVTAARIWRAVSSDPASVGGLADSLRRTGVRLDGALRAAATRVRRAARS